MGKDLYHIIIDLGSSCYNLAVKHTDFSVESNDNKPYDISLMTGSNNQTESEDDEQ